MLERPKGKNGDAILAPLGRGYRMSFAVSLLEGKLCSVQYPLVVRESTSEPRQFMLNVLFFCLTQDR